ncbi:MAG: alpha-amylase family glycosyl hydrolase [Chloroflexota bacterium]|nr:alpha-amylase family glycosyl hydrolase [Chloroflexota bacterium]
MTTWWQRGIVYQVYPRSFKDSDGDGVGDLPGITEKLDYLAWLGIDAVWISPIFQSPMADFGYDVSDYRDIHPLFGTLADFDALLAKAHALGLRVILDLVPNHTSDQHPWFIESASSPDNPKRDWYIWRDRAPDGAPPNNWLAYFGGISWTVEEQTGQVYLHNFLPGQPDLNYRNPEVVEAMLDNIRFWLDRGVDGFRVDVIDRMMKDPDLRDNPVDPGWKPGDNPAYRVKRVYSENGAGIHDLIRQFREAFDAYDERVIVGEIAYSTDPVYITDFYGTDAKPYGDEIHLPFNFALLMLPWRAEVLRGFIDAYDAAIPSYGWGNYVLGNHDQSRIATKIGTAQARVAAMLLLTLRGAPTIYYGDELGMADVPLTPSQYQDPQGINLGISRDPERTPMQWDGSANAGFTTGTPWLPVSADYQTHNVEAEREHSLSMLTLYRRLIAVRRSDDAFISGDYRSIDAPDGCLLYTRGGTYAVALNLTDQPVTVSLPHGGSIMLSTRLDREGTSDAALDLAAAEGVIVRLAVVDGGAL